MKKIFDTSIYVLARTLKYDKNVLGLMIGTAIVSGTAPYIYMIITAYIIRAVGTGSAEGQVVTTILFLLGVGFGLNVLKSFFNNMQIPLLNDYRQAEKRELNKKLLSGGYQRLETVDFWESYQKAQISVRKNYLGNEGLLRNIVDIGTSIVPFCGAVIAIRELDMVIVAIILVVSLVSNCLALWAENIICKSELQTAGLRARAEEFIRLLFDLDYQKDLRVCNIKNLLLGKYNVHTNKISLEEDRICKKSCMLRWTDGLVLAIQDIVIYIIFIYRYKNNEFDVAEWTLLISAVTMITYELTKISSLFSLMKSNADYVSKFREFLEAEDDSRSFLDNTRKIIKEKDYIIALNGVDFYYKDYYALKKIDLKIRQGERVAIVGLNGAGKSTLIKLLVGLYQPSSGAVLFKGRNVSDYERKEYYRHFSCAFQEVNTYPFSILTNVSLRKETETDTDRVLTLLQSILDNCFVDNLPQKENTILSRLVDKDGIDLSGGQRQRISLCRALYKDSEIFVLDEPTAALDPISEKQVFERINEIAKDKTVIFVSHRLVSTKFCDKIILLQDGCIKECGSHEQLMSSGGLYAELYRMQTSYYTSNGSWEETEC